MLKVIDSSTISESTLIMLAGGLLIGGIFLGTSEFKHVLGLICDVGMPTGLALSISLLQMPGTVVWVMPAAVIVSTALILLRRNLDFELIALATCGISPLRSLRPLLVIAFVWSILAFLIGDFVVPEARGLANQLIYVGVLRSEMPRNRNSLTLLRSSRGDGPIDRVFLIGRYLRARLENALVLDFTNPKVTKVIWSRSGKYENGQWLLFDGNVYELSDLSDERRSMRFAKMSYDALGLKGDEMLSKGVLAQEMSSKQLHCAIEKLTEAGKPVPAQMWMSYYRRFSQPLSCFLVTFSALPLVLIRRRQTTTGGLIYIGLVTVLFFIAQQCTSSLAQNNLLEPLLSSVLPALLIAALGFFGCVFYKPK